MMFEREHLGLIESFAQNIRLPFSVWTGIDTTHTGPTHRKCNETYFLINIDKTLIVVNHSLKLRFKQSHRFFIWAYKGFISSTDRQTKFDARVSKINMQPRGGVQKPKTHFFLTRLD